MGKGSHYWGVPENPTDFDFGSPELTRSPSQRSLANIARHLSNEKNPGCLRYI